MNAFSKAVVVLVCGVASFAFVGFLSLFLDQKLGFNAMSFSILFIVPVGAIIAGIIGCLGFFLSTTAVHFRPPGWLWSIIPLIAAVTFFGIYYGEYKTESLDDGTNVADHVSFPEYLQLTIKSTRVGRLKSTRSAEAGAFGYVIFGANFLGFLGASILVAIVMVGLPYCKKCERYFDDVGDKEIYFTTRENAEAFRVGHVAHEPFSREYVDSYQSKSEAEEAVAVSRMQFSLMECKKCKAQAVTECLAHKEGDDWKKDYSTEKTYEGKMGDRRLTT